MRTLRKWWRKMLKKWSWKKLLSKFKYRCAYCGMKNGRLTKDHVIARSKGGQDVIENIVPCCSHCNSSKSHHDWRKWYRQQPFYSRDREKLILQHIER